MMVEPLTDGEVWIIVIICLTIAGVIIGLYLDRSDDSDDSLDIS